MVWGPQGQTILVTRNGVATFARTSNMINGSLISEQEIEGAHCTGNRTSNMINVRINQHSSSVLDPTPLVGGNSTTDDRARTFRFHQNAQQAPYPRLLPAA